MSPRRLGDQLWAELRPQCIEAGTYSESAIKAWARIAAEAVHDEVHPDWRWLLADLRERCFDENIECPYQVTYLINLAETYTRVKGNFDRGVPVSVLIEGRNLRNLLELVKREPGMTVGRMKAYVFQDATKDPRSIDEIEAQQKRQRLEGKEKRKRRQHAEKIDGWPLDKAEDLLRMLADEANAYGNAIDRLQTEGASFDAGELTVALRAVKGLTSTLTDARPGLEQAA
jgi:hypothetical protein